MQGKPITVQAAKKIVLQDLALSPQTATATTDLATPAQTAAQSAKEQLAAIAQGMDSADTPVASQLATAITQAERIRDSYSYFNPYRYILSTKINTLKKLQKQAAKAEPEDSQKTQEKAKKELKNLVDWLG